MSRFANIDIGSIQVTKCPTRVARGLPRLATIQTRYKSHVHARVATLPRRTLQTAPMTAARSILVKRYRPLVIKIDITTALQRVVVSDRLSFGRPIYQHNAFSLRATCNMGV